MFFSHSLCSALRTRVALIWSACIILTIWHHHLHSLYKSYRISRGPNLCSTFICGAVVEPGHYMVLCWFYCTYVEQRSMSVMYKTISVVKYIAKIDRSEKGQSYGVNNVHTSCAKYLLSMLRLIKPLHFFQRTHFYAFCAFLACNWAGNYSVTLTVY